MYNAYYVTFILKSVFTEPLIKRVYALPIFSVKKLITSFDIALLSVGIYQYTLYVVAFHCTNINAQTYPLLPRPIYVRIAGRGIKRPI